MLRGDPCGDPPSHSARTLAAPSGYGRAVSRQPSLRSGSRALFYFLRAPSSYQRINAVCAPFGRAICVARASPLILHFGGRAPDGRPTPSVSSRWCRPAPRVVGRCRRCRSSTYVRLVLATGALPLAHVFWFPCVFGALPRARLARASVAGPRPLPPSRGGPPAPTLVARSLRSRPPLRSGYGTAVFRAGSAPSLRSVAPPALSFLPSLQSGFRFPSLRRSLRSLRWGGTHRSGWDPRCALPAVGAAGALAGSATLPRSLSRRQVWLRPFVRLWYPAGSY